MSNYACAVTHHHPPTLPHVQPRVLRDGALAVLVGVLSVVQARINGQLAIRVGSGLEAAAVSFGFGLVMVTLIVALTPSARAGVGRLISSLRSAAGLPWWGLLGGLGGATFVASQGLDVPSLGVALFTVAIVAGLTGNSLVADRLGVGPGGRRPITVPRVAAAILCIIGVGIAVSGDFGDARVSLALLLLALVAGGLVAFQQGLNGRVSVAAGSPFVAAGVNFIVGTVALLVIATVVENLDNRAFVPPPAPWSEPILWLGGPIGVAFVTVAAFAVRSLGVLLFSLLTIVGQLLGSVGVDVVTPTAGAVELSWQVLLAVLLSVVAAALAFFGARAPAAGSQSAPERMPM